MTFEEYQEVARTTAIYPLHQEVIYTALGLAGEAGEVANKVQKSMRDDKPWDEHALIDELGDVLWYVTNLAMDLGYSLEEVAERNNKKLTDRFRRGVIKGSGDNR